PVVAAERGLLDRDALHRQVRGELVDRRELGLHVGPQFLLALGDAPVRVAPESRRRDRPERFLAERAARLRIEREELLEDRRTGAPGPRDHDRLLDLLPSDRGRLAMALREEETRDEAAQDLLARHQPAHHVELCRALDLDDEPLESTAPVAVE